MLSKYQNNNQPNMRNHKRASNVAYISAYGDEIGGWNGFVKAISKIVKIGKHILEAREEL